mmetsp:Transcript_3054/g.6709  ORF Transcript_3054/g.6709 Transcript_3054/m.6709 type:complete len:85 (+) Transcript_3054:104-358(+)
MLLVINNDHTTLVLSVSPQNVHVLRFLPVLLIDPLSFLCHNPHQTQSPHDDNSGRCSSGSPETIASLTANANSASVLPSDSTGS